MRRRLALLAAFLSLAACGAPREKEPNDDLASATAVRAGRVQGAMASASDKDFYRIEVREPGTLSARVGGIRSMDFVLSVYGPDQRELKRCDETGEGGDESALDIGVVPGPYTLALSNKNPKAANPDQTYVLELALDRDPGHEAEPDDSLQTASPLVLSGVTRGRYYPSRNLLAGDTDYMEADWFRIDVQQADLFLLNISIGGVANVDPVLEIYDSNAYKLKEVSGGKPGEAVSFKAFGVRGPSKYYLRLRSRTRSANAAAPYEILTELLPYQGASEFEPNDQRQDATPMMQDGMTGTIVPEGDSDWVRVTVPGEGRGILRATLNGPDSLDLVLRLCDALGNPVAQVDNGGKGQPEALTGVGVTKGDYFLVVSEKSGRKADARQPYTLTRQLVDWQEGLESEVNDSTAAAQPIKLGQSVDGYIAPRGDADFYEFNVYQKGTVLFEAAGILNVRFQAALYDQEYNPVQAWTANKSGESMSFSRELDVGTYFLRLAASDPGQNNVRDKYSLRLSAK
ncbi:MAG: hypothetical protein A2X36_11465 [Elusimicrobia bacterium GWA2_69_24]|nr:MAG: hypothetical protein A2X36_11465 [Elusimicrobia bacterium GWA2_69_24]HBL16199.1 hypothetical protein [Elusimicrobiota bacterium]